MTFLRKITLLCLKIAICLACFFGLERLCHMATDGFRMDKIQGNLPLGFTSQYQDGLATTEEIKALLKQPFHYLDCGGQSFAFISQDGNYILKFFKFHHMRVPAWMEHIPLTGKLAEYRSKKIARKLSVIEKTFTSCKIAYDKLRNETGVVYLHLAPTRDLQLSFNLIDHIKCPHKLEADSSYFIIQKKGELAYKKIQTLVNNQEQESAKQAISSLIHLIDHCYQKGIRDLDLNIATNYGFDGDKAIHIDLGRFEEEKSHNETHISQEELTKVTRSFRAWLEGLDVELSDHLDQEIKALL